MTNRVDEIDLSLSMDKAKSIERVAAAQHRLTQLRLFTAGLLDPKVVARGSWFCSKVSTLLARAVRFAA